jgi:hypothetical protein
MRQHVDDPGFPQILDQIVDITAPVLRLHVTAGVESVEQDVGVASVFRKSGRNLIADQEVGVVQECEGPVYRLVVGERHEIHASPLRHPV